MPPSPCWWSSTRPGESAGHSLVRQELYALCVTRDAVLAEFYPLESASHAAMQMRSQRVTAVHAAQAAATAPYRSESDYHHYLLCVLVQCSRTTCRCGHCKTLAAPLAEAAEELQGEVKVVAVDATAEQSLGNDYGVKGFPTLKLFPAGKKSKSMAQEYNGGRSRNDIVTGVRAWVEANGGGGAGAGAAQLTGQAAWADNCAGKRVCIVAFLPSLLDEKAAKRAERLEALAAAAAKVNRRSLFRFLWSEVGAQPGLEKALDVGMVPAVFAVSLDKKVFTPYRGPLDGGALGKWATSLAVRNEGAVPLPAALPAIATVAEWDGKDAAAPAPAEEEISLEELGL